MESRIQDCLQFTVYCLQIEKTFGIEAAYNLQISLECLPHQLAILTVGRENEAGIDFVLMRHPSSCLSYVNHAVVNKKAGRVASKQGQSQPRFSLQ